MTATRRLADAAGYSRVDSQIARREPVLTMPEMSS
jgi:hypothetical protein